MGYEFARFLRLNAICAHQLMAGEGILLTPLFAAIIT